MNEYCCLDEFINADQEQFIPIIYDGPYKEAVPSGFNSVSIQINGCVNSDLNWNEAQKQARDHIKQGLRLFWEIDLGLFSHLNAPLSDRIQYLALGLALRHFSETLWKEFQSETVGLCLYRGPLEFRRSFIWNEEHEANFNRWLKNTKCHADKERLLSLYCCDAAISYFDLLTEHLPADLCTCLLLDTAGIPDPVLAAELLTKERFERFNRLVTKGALPFESLCVNGGGWMQNSSSLVNSWEGISVGICLPSIEMCSASSNAQLRSAIEWVESQGLRYRLVSEMTLTSEWTGLESLLVLSDSVSVQGRRKLCGFCAAGGTVVTLGNALGLSQEVPFDNWTLDSQGYIQI